MYVRLEEGQRITQIGIWLNSPPQQHVILSAYTMRLKYVYV